MTAARKPSPNIGAEQMLQMAGATMRAHFVVLKTKGKTRARTPEQFYGFRAVDVIEMYFRKHGFGRGLWYRLKDGRVIDAIGKPSEPDRIWYVSPAH